MGAAGRARRRELRRNRRDRARGVLPVPRGAAPDRARRVLLALAVVGALIVAPLTVPRLASAAVLASLFGGGDILTRDQSGSARPPSGPPGAVVVPHEPASSATPSPNIGPPGPAAAATSTAGPRRRAAPPRVESSARNRPGAARPPTADTRPPGVGQLPARRAAGIPGVPGVVGGDTSDTTSPWAPRPGTAPNAPPPAASPNAPPPMASPDALESTAPSSAPRPAVPSSAPVSTDTALPPPAAPSTSVPPSKPPASVILLPPVPAGPPPSRSSGRSELPSASGSASASETPSLWAPHGWPPGAGSAPAAHSSGLVSAAGPAKSGCGPANHPVRDAGGLTKALSSARPGDVLALADGVYRGNFTARAQGSAARPITLCGGRNAVLLGSAGYTLHLDGAAHWRVAGFTIRGGQKGLVADHAQGNVLENLVIEQVGQEGLHLRAASSDNTVRGNRILRTGLTDARFGEGIYVGSARRNWPKFGGAGPDRSDRNVLAGNTVTDAAAECVDIKEGTTGGVLRGNTFSGRALRGGYADSWVDVKGNRWLIADNVGSDSPVDGYQVHEILAGWGLDNRFTRNTSNLGAGTGFAVDVTKNPTRTVVGCDNTVTGGRGVTNVTCTNTPTPA